jgi:hypothetical protein
MPNLTFDLSRLALILWSGMLVIAGSIWILSSQVRRLADLLEAQKKETTTGEDSDLRVRVARSTTPAPAILRRGASPGPRRASRTVAASFRGPAPGIAAHRAS